MMRVVMYQKCDAAWAQVAPYPSYSKPIREERTLLADRAPSHARAVVQRPYD